MIERIEFGRTGHLSSRIIFGGAAFLDSRISEVDRTLEVLLKYGVNHIDTAESYGNSEKLIGRWMKQHRKNFFLATKTLERSYEGVMKSIQKSLELLRVDNLDLVQIHCIVEQSEWEQTMGPDGALDALIEARAKGILKYIGITSHDLVAPEIILKSIERFDFDSVLLPFNYLMMKNQVYSIGFHEVLSKCREKKTALQTIKTIARKYEGVQPEGFTMWYEPLSEQKDIDDATFWAMATPGIFINSAGDVNLLPKILDSAQRFSLEMVPTYSDMDALIKRRGMKPIFPSI
jgi:aryl-alcohol dehydrogenase-like predicted oxidoreductase